MKENKNIILNNKIILVIVTIIMLTLIILIVKFNMNKSKEVNSNIYEEGNNISKISENLTSEQTNKIVNEIGKSSGNETYKNIVNVNGKNINEKEIEFIDFQLNNEVVNKTGEKKDATEELIEQYVILQNAEERGQKLSESENKRIETNVKNTLERDMEDTNKVLKQFNMTYDEFLEFYTEREKKRQLVLNWNSDINHKINDGELEIDSEEFKNKYNEYKNSDNISIKYKLLTEMKEIYIDYLKGKAKIEYK